MKNPIIIGLQIVTFFVILLDKLKILVVPEKWATGYITEYLIIIIIILSATLDEPSFTNKMTSIEASLQNIEDKLQMIEKSINPE